MAARRSLERPTQFASCGTRDPYLTPKWHMWVDLWQIRLTCVTLWGIVSPEETSGTPGGTKRTGTGVFLGEYKHSVDSKGRIVMPRAYRDGLAGEVVVSQGRDKNLVVRTRSDWEEAAKQVRANSDDSKRGRAFRLRFFSTSDPQTVNGNTGRITLPAPLREFAEIDLNSEVVVVGNFETVEIWNVDKYAKQVKLGEEVYLDDEEDDPDDE